MSTGVGTGQGLVPPTPPPLDRDFKSAKVCQGSTGKCGKSNRTEESDRADRARESARPHRKRAWEEEGGGWREFDIPKFLRSFLLFSPLILCFSVHSSRGRETRILQTISFSKHILNLRWNAATIFKPGSTLKRRKALGFDFSSLTHVYLYNCAL